MLFFIFDDSYANSVVNISSNDKIYTSVFHDNKISSQIISIADKSQPTINSPNMKAAEPFLPTEKNFCSNNLIGKQTFQGYSIISGTNNPDNLNGTTNRDLILGLDGDDKINGLGEGDVICGGKGNDDLRGDTVFDPEEMQNIPPSGKDLIFGQEGNDIILGGAEDDFLYGGAGNDVFYGHQGDDYIQGGDGDDGGYGNGGDDSIHGSNGNDKFNGREGNDKLYGGKGNDNLQGDEGKDLLDGGEQYDKCYHGQDDTQNTMFLNCEFTAQF